MLTQNLSIISEYLHREVSLGRMQRLPLEAIYKGVHLSPIGAIPKKHRPGKWRLIVDLSSPSNASINDGISPGWSSLKYTTVDHLSTLILQEGKGAFLVKADIKEAYRMIPVHPHDQPLLGVEWDGEVFIDLALPFGLRSAPKIFSAVADALQWILIQEGVKTVLHYLDDFIFISGSLAEANYQKETLISTCQTLGVPSLTGLLQHAAKVIRPGKPFLRRLHALQSVGNFPHHQIRLNIAARADIIW